MPMPRGIEALPIDAQADQPLTFAPTPTPENLEEPETRALFLASSQLEETPVEVLPSYRRRNRIQRVNFNSSLGTLLLELDSRRTLRRLIYRPKLREFHDYGFVQKDNMHMTVVNYDNGRRIIKALDGTGKRPRSIAAAAKEIDWSWQPTGEILPFQGRQSGR